VSYSKERYFNEVRPALKKDLGIGNDLGIPRLVKVVLNSTSGDGAHDSKVLASMADDLRFIAGQKPIITKAKHSIASFKIREGMNIGVKVTLRKDRMYEFIDRLVYMALPRVRDFRGLSPRGFDGCGNFSMGVKEQIIFLEINYDKIDKVRGFDITVCTSSRSDREALALLRGLRFPFVN
jgi:large subunit ribosomal protein L5